MTRLVTLSTQTHNDQKTTGVTIRAAQYLRASTEHQQYSLENQSAVIGKYAEVHGFEIVRTYSDAAKSGVVLKHRTGLRQLLQDVVAGSSDLRAILVYDVSRWGRFQDTDESAHYEFLCKSAGVPVHYCAETFANDGSLPSLIMKALKRTMAGEYSRELGIKVFEGQKRLASLGFKQGGPPGYGLRRMLVSPDRHQKQPLAASERKSIATDRVILVPGPAQEVGIVREIYRMLLCEKRTIYGIARELNRKGVPYVADSEWDYQVVREILTHPKYCGCNVFNRSSSKLRTPVVKLPKSQWILKPGAFKAIVDEATFDEAQKILENRTVNKTNAELLDDLRSLLASKGRLSVALIDESENIPSSSTYRGRFGRVRCAYELIGYGRAYQFASDELWRRTTALREELFAQIVGIFPNVVCVSRRGGNWRGRLRLPNDLTVSVLVARSLRARKRSLRWQIDPVPSESAFVTLLARLDEANCSFLDFHILPDVDRCKRFFVGSTDPWLDRGRKLSDLSELCAAVAKVLAIKKPPFQSEPSQDNCAI